MLKMLKLLLYPHSLRYMEDKEKLKEMILDEIDTTLWDREVMPHYGLIPDWYVRYKDLAQLVWKYFNTD